jgi:hypothetical protein
MALCFDCGSFEHSSCFRLRETQWRESYAAYSEPVGKSKWRKTVMVEFTVDKQVVTVFVKAGECIDVATPTHIVKISALPAAPDLGSEKTRDERDNGYWSLLKQIREALGIPEAGPHIVETAEKLRAIVDALPAYEGAQSAEADRQIVQTVKLLLGLPSGCLPRGAISDKIEKLKSGRDEAQRRANDAEATIAFLRQELHTHTWGDCFRMKDAIDALKAKAAKYDRIVLDVAKDK